MEAAVMAASAAAEAAKEAASAASAAAAAAVKDVATAKETLATASASALHAKEAAAAAATAGEAAVAAVAAVAAAMRASKKRKFHLVDDDQGSPESEDVDFISSLPDAILGIIISLLPTKDGVRTQAISRRWRPIWRSTPLTLVADRELMSNGHMTINSIKKILSEHPGPAHCFSLNLFTRDCYEKIEGWLSSQALNNLQELELTYNLWFRDVVNQLFLLPSSVFRFAPTLRVAKFYGCHFPDLVVQLSLKFPRLKQLALERVTISEDALQSILSGCASLESLVLKDSYGFGRLCISSKTLKCLGFCAGYRRRDVVLQELVIEDAPCLERLLPLNSEYGPATIRVISAPKLKILGMICEKIAELQFGTTVFQKMIAVSLTTRMRTVRVLVLVSAGPNLDTVINFLKCFPCLERLYVILDSQSGMGTDNVRKYDPLDPIECFELHLKEVVLKDYDGTKKPSIEFTKFFILNAKVLKEMKITLPYHRQHTWFAKQRKMLQIKNRASGDARIELKCGTYGYFTHNGHIHDLSMADPFDIPSSRCSNCCCGPF
uniref:Uncharacterized protein n=1 Tax=Avena sativa TaxID=4498 RepID=A0ACD5W5K9_AVESA